MTEERLSEITKTQAKAKFWHSQIEQSDKHEKPFRQRGEKIIERYRDEEKTAGAQRYALLWANTQLNLAALIGQIPSPDVSRRWINDSAVIRDAAEVMQKGMAHPMDDPSSVRGIRDGVLEGSLPGRGVLRVRYEAEFEEVETGRVEQVINELGQPIMRPVMVETEDGTLVPETEERKASERVYLQRVYWQDYRQAVGRCPDDVWWQAYRHHKTRDELIEDFGNDVGKKIPLVVTTGQPSSSIGKNEDGVSENDTLPAAFGRAELWEIWNKKDKTVIWIAKGYNDIIKEEPPAIDLEGFYDCAAPLTLYTTTDNNIPLAEYAFYQELTREIDDLQKRIAGIVSSCRVVGFYHAALKDFGDLSRITDGTFYPTDEKLMFATADGSAPGLERLITSLPIERWASIVPLLSNRMEQLKQAVFEITGFSDLLRGQTRASETLGAQNLKAQFGSFRLLPKQRAVQEWLEGTYAICGEIIAEMFDAETITRMTGIGQPKEFEAWLEEQGGMPEAEDQEQAALIQEQLAQQYQAYAEGEAEHFDQVMAFLRDNRMRSFRVNVELDELARPDRQAMQAMQAEAMSQTTQFMNALESVPQPIVPAMLAMYKSWVRNFKLGGDTEDLIDEAIEGYPRFIEQIEQSQQEAQQRAEEQAQQPSPDAVVKSQTDQAIAELKAQTDVHIAELREQVKAAVEELKIGSGTGNDVQHHEDAGLDADTVVRS